MTKVAKRPAEYHYPHWVWVAAVPIFVAAALLYPPGAHLLQSIQDQQQHPSVTIRQGTIIGRMIDDGTFPKPLEGFMGIPYALPPVNELRFQPAVTVPEGNGTLKAFFLGPR